MLVIPQSQLLNKGDGFFEFIKYKQYDNIKLLYSLYKEEPDSLKPIGELFKNYIIEEGKTILKEVELLNSSGKPFEIKEIIS